MQLKPNYYNMSKVYRANLLKKQQNIKKIENTHNLVNNNEELKNLIIKPVKVDKNNNKDVQNQFKKMQDIGAYEKDINKNIVVNKLWNERTNIPYKKIIYDDIAMAKFLAIKNPKTNDEKKILEREFIIHKVTNNDKMGADNRFNNLKTNLEKHNNELKKIYSVDNKKNHEEKFIYNHKYKHMEYQNNACDNDPKQSSIDYYKSERENKQKVNNIVQYANTVSIKDKKELYKNRQKR